MNNQDNDFRKKILKLDKSRTHKITNSLGVYDAYKYYRTKTGKDRLTESQFYKVIRTIHKYIKERILNNGLVSLPCRMGVIELRKYNTKVELDKNGNIKTNKPIDWDTTIQLWSEDEQSFKDKVLIKHECKEVFKLYYNKKTALFKNKSISYIQFNKTFKQELKNKIQTGVIDAPYLKKYYG